MAAPPQQSEVKELQPIEEAFVPLLKMRYNGVKIDMTFARMSRDCVFSYFVNC